MFSYVYVLGSVNTTIISRTYVGWTTDLERRLFQHNSGSGAKSTRGYKWILLYAERYNTQNEAMSREWHLKRNKIFRKVLRNNFI